jgi:hypothetical protein
MNTKNMKTKTPAIIVVLGSFPMSLLTLDQVREPNAEEVANGEDDQKTN